jgi:hypothetical protein
MRIQQTTDSGAGTGYALDVKVTWLTPEMIRLSFLRTSDVIEYSPQDYYVTPEELMKMADHINDVLCR